MWLSGTILGQEWILFGQHSFENCGLFLFRDGDGTSASVDYLKVCASPLHVSVLGSSQPDSHVGEAAQKGYLELCFDLKRWLQCSRRAPCDMPELLRRSCLHVLALASWISPP